MHGTDTVNYKPALWEKIVSSTVSVLTFMLVGWLVIRNQPFADPNLVVLLRIVLSIATAVLGATIPGLLHLSWKGKGLAIRAGGACALFVLSYLWSPTVIQPTPPPPLTADEISTVRAQGFHYGGKIRSDLGPFAAGAFKKDLEPLANKLWADSRYEKQAPQATALVYRLYAAALLIQPLRISPAEKAQNALPWLRKAISLDNKSSDHDELIKAEKYLTKFVEGKTQNEDVSILFRHEFRVAMPGATASEIEKHVKAAIELIKGLKVPCGSRRYSPEDDFNYLQEYHIGDFTLGQGMQVLRHELQGRFPNVDIGGEPIYVPLPNCNTQVRYIYKNEVGGKPLIYEWEVNKEKHQIVPLSDAAHEVMLLQTKRPDAVADSGKKERIIEAKKWNKHLHPHGFTFIYPQGWTVIDDKENKSTLLLPRGVTLRSPGAKAIFLIAAQHGFNDPFAIRSYLEKQFAPPAIITTFTQEPFTGGIGPGAIFNWEVFIPKSNTRSGINTIVVIINNWAVRIDSYGPRSKTKTHNNTMRRIATSFAWD